MLQVDMQPKIQYTSGDPQIAYQVVGDGELDLLFAFDWASNLDLIWQHPSVERFLRRLSSFSRLIVFDTRGMGLSDPVIDTPAPEEWMDDVRAVMDAAGSERAAIVGHGHGGQLGALFAASHPERTQALVLINSFARLGRAPDYPAGMPEGVQERVLTLIQGGWGTGLSLGTLAPDLAGDERARQWWAGVERANIRQSSWSGVGAPQLTMTGCSPELISKERHPACAFMLSAPAGAAATSATMSVCPRSMRA